MKEQKKLNMIIAEVDQTRDEFKVARYPENTHIKRRWRAVRVSILNVTRVTLRNRDIDNDA